MSCLALVQRNAPRTRWKRMKQCPLHALCFKPFSMTSQHSWNEQNTHKLQSCVNARYEAVSIRYLLVCFFFAPALLQGDAGLVKALQSCCGGSESRQAGASCCNVTCWSRVLCDHPGAYFLNFSISTNLSSTCSECIFLILHFFMRYLGSSVSGFPSLKRTRTSPNIKDLFHTQAFRSILVYTYTCPLLGTSTSK